MIEEHAVVIAVERDVASLEVVRRSACGLCGQTRGCGISLFGRLFGHRSHVFKAENSIHAKAGDHVIVAIEEHALLNSALMLYGIPLMTLLLGAILGHVIFPGDSVQSDVQSLIGAVVGLLLGLGWVKGHTVAGSVNSRYQPKISRLAEGANVNFKCE